MQCSLLIGMFDSRLRYDLWDFPIDPAWKISTFCDFCLLSMCKAHKAMCRSALHNPKRRGTQHMRKGEFDSPLGANSVVFCLFWGSSVLKCLATWDEFLKFVLSLKPSKNHRSSFIKFLDPSCGVLLCGITWFNNKRLKTHGVAWLSMKVNYNN